MRRTTRAPRTASAPRTRSASQAHLPLRLLRASFLPRSSPVPRVLLPATALLLAALLTACGSDNGRGHAALGAAGPADDRSPTGPVPPHEGITLTPLDGDGAPATGNGSPPYASSSPTGSDTSATPGSGGAPPAAPNPATGSRNGDGSSRAADQTSTPGTPPGRPSEAPPQRPPARPTAPPGPGPAPSPRPTPTPTPTPAPKPNTPPHLTTGPVNRTGADVRWCENVSLTLRNTGGRPVTSGTVTFGTHIIGALGIDWTTRTSTHPLPTPITGHTHRTATWRVCVSAWRVPLGMHIETRDVRVDWH
ncbi:hypothetical protein OEIGOIKO_03918 [Streptomyces chrestomyceticus JCM 4735]|uniref:Uncharacterized protein n=1 Tax=Streptomyces chrestomyceticus JCM 4735 TaxID=1306181 RepID=A0A7U9KVH0_9ACTN|nr:hypothetical protein [Streptomyces chrestomyceticus]GCD36162.1 hypothetical protein OEIGOIKO_03918 [Streptomyces chrestomyceticus JCM 4735]